ncbi:MAG TPA: YhjD/YihY/BrkB family envelope integrity protein [Actinomycetota bacterium]|nr:YhjD/YihY/BrkB family envelope integrity protein [Actinomycetota bacterium]
MDVHTLVRRLDRFQRRHAVIAFPISVVKHFGEDGAGRLAATIAYYGFFSLFPLLLVLVTIAGFVLRGHPDLQERLLDSALGQFPILGTYIRQNVGTITGSGLALGVGLATALWAGLGALRASQFAMDAVWDVPFFRRPPIHRAILRSLLMLATLGVFLLATAMLASILGGTAAGASGVWGMIGSAVLNVALFAVMYRVLTVADIRWRDVVPGAVLAGIGWTALLIVGGAIVSSRLGSASDVYASFAIVIGLLAWLHLGAQLTLFAAEVNVVRSNRLWPRSLDPRDMTRADVDVLARLTVEQRRREDQIVSVRYGDKGNPGSGEPSPGPGQGSAPPPDRPRRAVGSIVASVADGFRTLVRKQIELAKIEMTEAASARAIGAGMMGAAAVLGLFALGFAAAAGAAGLAIVLPAWAALLIVAAGFVVIAGGLMLGARRAMRTTPMAPERTQETLKEDARWARQQIAR